MIEEQHKHQMTHFYENSVKIVTYHGEECANLDILIHNQRTSQHPDNTLHPPLDEGILEQLPQPSIGDNSGYPKSDVLDKQ